MIDDSSRSDDSSLEKPVTPIVPNEDSDSQASSNKRYDLINAHFQYSQNHESSLITCFFYSIFIPSNRSLDCESSESHITATETSEPDTKKCKITDE